MEVKGEALLACKYIVYSIMEASSGFEIVWVRTETVAHSEE